MYRKISIAIILTLFIVFATNGLVIQKETSEIPLGDQLVRFHVIANSNHPNDQTVKNQVRDSVIEYLDQKLSTQIDVAEAIIEINGSIPEIKNIAEERLLELGIEQPIVVTLGKTMFPTRRYGSITFPAGEYQSLRVVLGEGQGQNWWCVLFPPLCFVDIAHGVTNEVVESKLAEVMGKESLTALKGEEMVIEIEFSSKIAEILRDSSTRFAKYLQIAMGNNAN